MCLLISSPLDARADVPSCSDPRIAIEGPIDARFSEGITSACAELATLPSLDPTARLVITPVGKDLLLEVSLADGRSALRRVRTPGELLLTFQALLSLPPTVERTTEPPHASDDASRATEPKAPARAHESASDTKPSAPRERPLAATSVSVEIGAEIVGRASGSPLYLSVGPRLFGGVRVERWLFALLARWDAFEGLVRRGYAGVEMNGLGAGFLVAPRIVEASALELDAGLATTFLTEEQGAGEGANEKSGSSTDFRLAGVVRALVGNGKLRALFSFDAEISPLRLRRSHRIDPSLPVLPSFGAGVGAGFAWVGP